jgi:hypothetical protein
MWCQNPESNNLKKTHCENLKTYTDDDEVVLKAWRYVSML